MSSPSAVRHTTVASIATAWPLRPAASRPLTQAAIDRDDIGSGEQSGQQGCRPQPPRQTWATTHPLIRSSAGHRHPPPRALPLDQSRHVAITALHRKERSGIHHQHHAAPLPPPRPRPGRSEL